MNFFTVEDKEKARKDRAKQAIALAMQSRWKEAEVVNRSILRDFPEDLEAYNRLGKALSELGRNREAKEAFQRALEISPNNGIAKKNLDRLMRLGDDAPRANARSNATRHVFIEESGKAGVTSLVNLALPDVLLMLAPGHTVRLDIDGGGLRTLEASGEYVGQVEPRLGTRLTRLIKGGNQYEATVTSVGEREVTIIVREVYQHPSQTGVASFPSRGGAGQPAYVTSGLLGYELGEEGADDGEPVVVKDWSDDDTEPGDDEAYTPVVHSIVNTEEPVAREEEDF